MKKWMKIGGGIVAGLVVLLVAGVLFMARGQAIALVHNPPEGRDVIDRTPAEYNLKYEDLTLTAADGLHLAAWYIPSQNGAAVIAVHGFKADREEMLNEADMLARHGYGVLLIALRAHDHSEGEVITFGLNEVRDLEAAYQYLLARPEVDPERIGVLGNSMGGTVALLYTAQNPEIKAVVSQATFASLEKEVGTGIKRLLGLPPFPFAPLIQFFAEQEVGFRARDVSAEAHIGEISPRPVFLMQGGADTLVPPESGQILYDAAGQPKELWFDPALEHVRFDTERAAEYEQRVTAFFDQYLLQK